VVALPQTFEAGGLEKKGAMYYIIGRLASAWEAYSSPRFRIWSGT